MVVEAEVQVIVMACNEQEAGKHKCERYWYDSNDPVDGNTNPTDVVEEETEKLFGKYYVRLLKSRQICPDFLVRTMRLRWTNEKNEEEERTVCQFHYTAWPDHGIPTQVKPLLEMVRLIRDCQASETLPVIIHCSAGCGRTGTICAIDFIWGLLRTGKLTSDFSLYDLVRDMRKQRVAMVQTVDQYILVHRAVKELFLEQLRVIDDHPYENVDDDGHPIVIEDEINPDYETVFVNNDEVEVKSVTASEDGGLKDHEAMAETMEKVLAMKMAAQSVPKTVMGTAMLKQNSSNSDLETPQSEVPPKPPPKQRNQQHFESKVIENVKQQVVTVTSASTENILSSAEADKLEQDMTVKAFSKSNPDLFDPPSGGGGGVGTTSSSSGGRGPQKLRKGNLRLMKTENGKWKLEETRSNPVLPQQDSLEPLDDLTNNVNNNSTSSSNSSSTKVSPKKSKSKNKGDRKTGENGGGGELLRRPSIKKIKAFFQQNKDNGNSSNTDKDLASAMSKMPKLGSDGDHHSSSGMVTSKSVPNSLDRRVAKQASSAAAAAIDTSGYSSLDKRPASRPSGPREMLIVQKSASTEKLAIEGSGGHNALRPSLPIKRSKSMKTVVMTSAKAESSDTDNDSSFGFEAATQPQVVALQKQPPPKPKRSMDYLTSIEPEVIKSQLASHSRQNSSEADASGKQRLNSLLMASFEKAEKEGEQMMIHNKSTTSGGFGGHPVGGATSGLKAVHSAESSPMTTMQKHNSSSLFSSHSSPSNSYR